MKGALTRHATRPTVRLRPAPLQGVDDACVQAAHRLLPVSTYPRLWMDFHLPRQHYDVFDSGSLGQQHPLIAVQHTPLEARRPCGNVGYNASAFE